MEAAESMERGEFHFGRERAAWRENAGTRTEAKKVYTNGADLQLSFIASDNESRHNLPNQKPLAAFSCSGGVGTDRAVYHPFSPVKGI